jgi:hypothetical protein
MKSKQKILPLKGYETLLNKIKKANLEGESENDFYNDVMDAYNDGEIEKKDFERIMKEVLKF